MSSVEVGALLLSTECAYILFIPADIASRRIERWDDALMMHVRHSRSHRILLEDTLAQAIQICIFAGALWRSLQNEI